MDGNLKVGISLSPRNCTMPNPEGLSYEYTEYEQIAGIIMNTATMMVTEIKSEIPNAELNEAEIYPIRVLDSKSGGKVLVSYSRDSSGEYFIITDEGIYFVSSGDSNSSQVIPNFYRMSPLLASQLVANIFDDGTQNTIIGEISNADTGQVTKRSFQVRKGIIGHSEEGNKLVYQKIRDILNGSKQQIILEQKAKNSSKLDLEMLKNILNEDRKPVITSE